jgi:pre-60S factor REI1
VTEALFVARQSAIAKEKEKNETPMLYSCVLCNKGYRSSKAHDQHLKSRSHILRASQGTNQEEENTVIKQLPRREVNKRAVQWEADAGESEESEDEWEEVGSDEELVAEATKSLTGLNVNEMASLDDIVEDDEDDVLLDPSCCFVCDQEHDNIESCMVHMHKQHGFFIPDVEYLKDPQGLLTYLGLKVLYYMPCSLFAQHILILFYSRSHIYFYAIFSSPGEEGFHVFVLQ